MFLKRLMVLELISLILLLFFSIAQDIEAKKDPSLVLYFSFDEGSGKEVKDLSGTGNDGELVGSPNWINGQYGKALQMTSEADHVEVAHSDSLVFEDGVTYMAWSLIEKWTGDGDQWIDKGAHSAKGTGCGIMVHASANFYFMLGDGAARQDLTFPAAGKVPVGKEWHHIAATYEGKKMIAYGDGEPFGEQDASFKLSCTTDKPLLVGGGVERPQYVFDGAIDEVAIFNRALSQDEIKQAMEGISKMLSVEPDGRLTTTWGRIKEQR
jgi:hypothetical protein